jgi:hypothetical protein
MKNTREKTMKKTNKGPQMTLPKKDTPSKKTPNKRTPSIAPRRRKLSTFSRWARRLPWLIPWFGPWFFVHPTWDAVIKIHPAGPPMSQESGR